MGGTAIFDYGSADCHCHCYIISMGNGYRF